MAAPARVAPEAPARGTRSRAGPVLAFDAGAVRETLQGGGILLEDKEPEVIAELLGVVMTNASTRAAVLETQERALARIRSVDIGERLDQALRTVEESQ